MAKKGRVQRLLATINREPKQKNKQLCHPEFEEEEMSQKKIIIAFRIEKGNTNARSLWDTTASKIKEH